MKYIQNNHEVESEETFFGHVYYLKDTDKKIAVVGGFGIGAPAAVVALEMLQRFAKIAERKTACRFAG